MKKINVDKIIKVVKIIFVVCLIIMFALIAFSLYNYTIPFFIVAAISWVIWFYYTLIYKEKNNEIS